MKTPIHSRIKDVFISQSLKLDKESKVTSGRAFNSRLFISCDFEAPYQLRKYFNRPHSTAYNFVSRITLTDETFNKVCETVWTKSLHGHTASIEIKYLGEDSVQVIACGAFSGYAVLWRGRLQDLVRYFNDHHTQCSTHETYQVTFKGRKSGAIGVDYSIKLQLSVPLEYSMNNKVKEYLYEVGYEHITGLKEMVISQNSDINYLREL